MRAAAQPCGQTAARSLVLLVITGGTVSRAAITRAAELAAGASVTVVGVGSGQHISRTDGGPPAEPAGGRDPRTEPEAMRRAVALAMSVLENTGVMALGHIAVTGSPARVIARVARARGARAVVLDYPGQASGGLAAELRRRMYGSGMVVVSTAENGIRWPVPS
jgi:diacylglycerol kinase family enzyme